jgi:hypothetical protein
MLLVRQSNPHILEQALEWTFLKVHNLLNKKMASKKNFTYILARTLRPKEAAWSRSGILRLKKKN